jgi:hypothetical protein
MSNGDARSLQQQLAKEFEYEPEHEAAVTYADAVVVGLTGDEREREHALAYQIAREYYARLHDSAA